MFLLLLSRRLSGSSRRWLDRQRRDPVVAHARERGLRSRAALKLQEMQERGGVLAGPRAVVVDLGCAPGGWAQVASRGGGRTVVGVDLLS